MRRLIALSIASVLAACGDLNVRSVRAPQSVPVELAGEWVGSWQAATESASGAIVVQVQEYGGAPVVNVMLQNPCITPSIYELVVTGDTFELRAEGAVVLAATLQTDRRLVGTYQCPEESGTWSATWQRPLPELLDLGGHWVGQIAASGQPARGFALELTQSVAGGLVRLEGLLDLGELWPLLVPMRGSVAFRTGGYDLVLQTLPGITPNLLLAGAGVVDPLQVDNGVLQAVGAPVLSVPFAAFSMHRVGP